MSKMIELIAKNLFHKPPTRLYPKEVRETYERSRGQIVFNTENCIHCSLCARKCPADAITVDRTAKSWELNAFRCIICGECIGACPKKCITLSKERRSPGTEKLTVKVTKEG